MINEWVRGEVSGYVSVSVSRRGMFGRQLQSKKTLSLVCVSQPVLFRVVLVGQADGGGNTRRIECDWCV